MLPSDQYELVDFGEGRKLERFGPYLLDRPAAAAKGQRQLPNEVWKSANGHYDKAANEGGGWTVSEALPTTWTIACDFGNLELKPTDAGQIGVFPEQAENWNWIAKQVRRARRKLKVLNLFAYTGASTLAAASAGADVVHVDAARTSVERARRNAELSKLADAPIRWIVEDATKFVSRELRRDNRYNAVILDPPSYGHGPQGETWKIYHDLLPLLEKCAELTAHDRAFVLLTCHSPDFGPAEMQACLSSAFIGHCQGGVTAKPLYLRTSGGRKLHSGVMARWPS